MENSNVFMLVHITAKDGSVQKLNQILNKVAQPSRKEKGCMQYEFTTSEDKPNEFLIVEKWRTHNDAMKHLETKHVVSAREHMRSLIHGEPKLEFFRELH